MVFFLFFSNLAWSGGAGYFLMGKHASAPSLRMKPISVLVLFHPAEWHVVHPPNPLPHLICQEGAKHTLALWTSLQGPALLWDALHDLSRLRKDSQKRERSLGIHVPIRLALAQGVQIGRAVVAFSPVIVIFQFFSTVWLREESEIGVADRPSAGITPA